MIEIETSYALDDSCQMKLWARGHYPWGAFMDAVEAHLKREDRNDIPRWVYTQAPVKSVYQRCVPCRDSIVSDSMYVYSDKPGRGASPVTVLDIWFPLHRYFQQDADKVGAQPINVRAAHNAIMDGYTKDSNEQFHYMNGYRRAVIRERKTDPAMAGDELPEPIGHVATDESGEFYGLTWFRGPGHSIPDNYAPVYSADQMRKRVQPASGEDATDAQRYRALRDDDYQMLEDDPCVTDDSLNTFFSEDLDKAVDALIFRRDAAMRQERQP